MKWHVFKVVWRPGLAFVDIVTSAGAPVLTLTRANALDLGFQLLPDLQLPALDLAARPDPGRALAQPAGSNQPLPKGQASTDSGANFASSFGTRPDLSTGRGCHGVSVMVRPLAMVALLVSSELDAGQKPKRPEYDLRVLPLRAVNRYSGTATVRQRSGPAQCPAVRWELWSGRDEFGSGESGRFLSASERNSDCAPGDPDRRPAVLSMPVNVGRGTWTVIVHVRDDFGRRRLQADFEVK